MLRLTESERTRHDTGNSQPVSPAVHRSTGKVVTLLLCSDGLWGQMPPERLVHAFSDRSETLDARAKLAIHYQDAGRPRIRPINQINLDGKSHEQTYSRRHSFTAEREFS